MIPLFKTTGRRDAGQKVTYPGETNAADGPAEHVCQHCRERLSSWKVGKKIWVVPVGDLEIKTNE